LTRTGIGKAFFISAFSHLTLFQSTCVSLFLGKEDK